MSDTSTISAAADRMRATRRRRKRQIRLFKIEVAVPDLEAIAARGYPDALSSDAEVAAKALEAFFSDEVA